MIEPGAKNFFVKIMWLALLFAALAAMFRISDLNVRDLSQTEGLYAAFASETNISAPMNTAHGVGIKNRHFLYPLLTSVITKCTGLPMPEALRFINLFFAAATALLIGLIAGFTRDFKAGIIGAAFFSTNLFVLFHTMDASHLMMSTFLLFAAQIAWIYFGFTKGHWNTAWITSLLLVSSGFLAGGIKVPICFFLPLFFLHRPLKLSSKISKKGFAIGMVFLGTALLMWVWPFVMYARDITWDYIQPEYRGMSNFLLNIIWSPLQILLFLLPWTLIIWMPFCAALKPLEKTPIFSHYFRVMFITNFIVIVFNPLSTMDDFMFTIPPLALLCAITYDTAVRRYSVEMRRIVLLCGYIVALLSLLLILYCFMPYEIISHYFEWLPLTGGKEHIFGTILAFLILAAWIYHYRKHGQLWLIMLFSGAAIGLFVQLTFLAYHKADRSRSELGKKIFQSIREDGGDTNSIIYKNNILDLYSESYYMAAPVKKINNFSAIDKKAPVIYLLTTDFPQYSERTWKKLYEGIYRNRKLYLYRGDITKRKEVISRRKIHLNSTEE